jgi:hypothetical protein
MALQAKVFTGGNHGGDSPEARIDRIDLPAAEDGIAPHPPRKHLFLICRALPILSALPCAAMAINGIAISSSDPGAVPGASTKVRAPARRILAGAK